MQRALLRLSRIAVLLCVSRVFLPVQLPAQQVNTTGVDDALEGKRIFATSCAACHGLDGHGAERGPDIAGKPEIRQLGDQDLSRIVQDGIAGTGMPSFSVLGADGIQAVIRHLRSLQGQSPAEKLPGDPGRGKDLFFAEGRVLALPYGQWRGRVHRFRSFTVCGYADRKGHSQRHYRSQPESRSSTTRPGGDNQRGKNANGTGPE